MALKTPVVDRIPTYPGRVILTPVSGLANTYDLARADSPLEEGTPINKALFDQKAYALTSSVVVYVSHAGSDDTGDGSSAAPFATIQKAVDALPKCLEGYTATISIESGIYEERVVLSGFQGGIVELGTASKDVVVRGVQINACSVIRVNVSITRSSTLGGTPMVVRNGSVVQLGKDIVVDGVSAGVSGIVVELGSNLTAIADLFGMQKTTINNCVYNAVYAASGSSIHLVEVVGTNNGIGMRADGGSTITYDARSLTATTANITRSGGRIYSGAQSNIPAY